MATLTQRKMKKEKPAVKRSVVLVQSFNAAGVAALELTVGRDKSRYLLTRLEADFGQGWQLAKLADIDTSESVEAIYAVNLATGNDTCECLGFLRHGHCKHVDGLKALVAAGKI